MFIVYQDEIGLIELEINAEYGIDFNNGFAWFTGADDIEYKIPVIAIRMIHE